MTEPRDPHHGPGPDRQWTIRVDDIELAGYEWGAPTAEPLVLIHGASDTHRAWEQVAATLADEFRVITYDVRGHGRSGTPSGLGAYRLDRLAEDLYTVLETVSPDRPAHLAGHGWGAMQGWEAVADPRAGTRIASFTALSAPHLDHIGLWLRQLRYRTRRGVHRLQSRTTRRFVSSVPAASGRVTHPAAPEPPRHRPILGRERHSVGPHRALPATRTARRTPMAVSSALDEARVTLHSSPSLLRRAVYQPRLRTCLRQIAHRSPRADTPIAPTWRTDLVAGMRIVRANLGHHLCHPRDQRTAVPVQLLLDTADPVARAGIRAAVHERVDRLWCYTLPADHWLPVTEPLLVGEAIANFIGDLRADNDPAFRTTH
ncbi:alpha/beta fold hydrolase [Nocardia cyriacigeorgica]|uniref:alpha/beta fold hydrolase n=1 Tax=Nocardia cyriacigeorgica TaxID=135487 RepID=UPI00245827A5|nr:alpha/beta fold hydrolase [Nocardia cyriacigeorgica]